MNKNEWLKKAMERYNGCPLFNGREKGDIDELTNEKVTLDATYRFSSKDGNYHAFTVVEQPDKVYMSGGALKELLNEAEEKGEIEDLCSDGLVFIIKPLISVKSQSGRTFRPIEVVGFGR